MKTKVEKDRRIKKFGKIIFTVGSLAVAFGVVVSIFYLSLFRYKTPLTEFGVPEDFTKSDSEYIVYNDKKYKYNKDVLPILFIGYDKTEQREMQGMGYAADVLILAAVNTSTGKITLISIPRDTLTSIAVFDFDGKYVLTDEFQIALSYAYGYQNDIGADLTMAAVSNMLCHIPIKRFVSLNIDGIGPLTDAVGGVELTILEDFTAYDMYMRAGSMFKLHGELAERYVRERQGPNMSGLNSDRMIRQEQFIKVYVETLKNYIKENPKNLIDFIKTAGQYVKTNLTVNEMLFLFNRLRGANSESVRFVTLPGKYENIKEILGTVYIPDSDKIEHLILNTFYIEEKGN